MTVNHKTGKPSNVKLSITIKCKSEMKSNDEGILLFYPSNGSTMFLPHYGLFIPHVSASHSGRQSFSSRF